MFVRYKAQTLPDVYKITKLVFDINFNAQLKFWTDNKMETWFWILGWILSILTVAGNGFTVLLVGGQPRLRTKTNALIVSLAVADSVLGRSLFLHCSSVTSEVAATGLNSMRPGWIL